MYNNIIIMNDSTFISKLPDRTNNGGIIQGQFQDKNNFTIQNSTIKDGFNNGNQRNQDNSRDNQLKNSNSDINTNTYVPMNIHTNPYGFKNDIEVQQFTEEPTQERMHRLPSRDIPIEQTSYIQDEGVKANYINEPKNIKDYIQDYKEEESERIRNHNLEKNKLSRFDRTVSELQEFVLIAILYFMSQLPLISIVMKKYLSALGIFETDGNLNVYGKIFKSVSFALLYCVSFQAINRSFPTI